MMKRRLLLPAALVGLTLLSIALPSAVRSADDPATVPLFDGKTLAGWTMANGKPITGGWEVLEGGVIHRASKSGDIVTARDFTNFIFEFEFKAAPKTNSGVKYRFGAYGNQRIGLEYQVEDVHPPVPNIHTTAGLYDLLAPTVAVKPVPETEWNQAKIVVRGNRIEHWLNGEKRVSVTLGSPEWDAALAKSKFKDARDFGTKPGRLLLQEHGGEVWFRNLRLQELPSSLPAE